MRRILPTGFAVWWKRREKAENNIRPRLLLKKSVVHREADQTDDYALNGELDRECDCRYQDEAADTTEYRIQILRMMLRLLNAVNESGDGADQGQHSVDWRRQAYGPRKRSFREKRAESVAHSNWRVAAFPITG
jgi:hypothetical protein